jgi:predicted hydrocarbon binding protein
MSEARIGRVTSAAVHAAIAKHAPFRVQFYEQWLQPPRLRAGTVGMASFLAVLSFLREEGDLRERVVSDAGRLAADWTFAHASAWSRARWRWASKRARARIALKLTHRLAVETAEGARAKVRWSGGRANLQVDGSPFCTVRTLADAPLCGYYAAALERFCEQLGLAAAVGHEQCRGMGAECCVVVLDPTAREAAPAVTTTTA